MKFGYLSKKSHELEKLRNSYIMKTYGYSILPKISFFQIFKLRPNFFYIDDHISFFELVKITLLYHLNLISNIVIRCSELYTINFYAYQTEVDNHIFNLRSLNKNTLVHLIWSKRVYLKIWIFQFILRNSKTKLLLPSILRKEYYLSNSNGKCTVIVLRNLPLANELNFTKINFSEIFSSDVSDVIYSGKYLLLAGNINAYDDLITISKYAKQERIQIIIASNDKLTVSKLKKIFPENILFIGIVDHNVILNLVYNCSAGIVLYNNETINQKLSASSKLFEFLYFNKHIIVSNNQGVISELNSESYPYKIIDKKQLLFKNHNFTADNSKFYFENEVESIKNILKQYI